MSDEHNINVDEKRQRDPGHIPKFDTGIPFSVIDFEACRIARNLADRGIQIKKNNRNQVKMMLRLSKVLK